MGFEQLPETTADLAQERLARLRALFPECVTEGPGGPAVDFDLLRRALSPEKVVEGPRERYRLEWPGKRAALYAANAPTASTLRPVRKRSKDFDATRNLYVEGDNLEALKLLRTAYSGKVKLIYIDPPYNTGHDFIYHDSYVRSVRDELAKAGLLDDAGRLTENKDPFRKNDETNGRYHSDWLTMMYPRLLLARDLLADDGVIFISIDDNEQANLKRLCDEIFGAGNFVACFVWEKKRKASNLDAQVRGITDYILCYRKEKDVVLSVAEDVPEENKPYPIYNSGNKRAILTFPGGKIRTRLNDGMYPAGDYPDEKTLVRLLTDVTIKDGVVENTFQLEGEWRYSQGKLDELLARNETIVLKGTKFKPYWLNNEERVKKIRTLLTKTYYDVGTNEDGNAEVAALLGKEIFSFPKPVMLVKKLVEAIGDTEGIVLDFFSGSGTTAHAVMALNAEDGGKRQFILVQLPEKAELGSAAAEAGFADICAIGEERIRRAGEAILGERPELRGKLDVGFRVLRVDEKNELEAARTPAETLEDWAANQHEKTIKPGRTEEDLLFQALLRVAEPLLVERIERREAAPGATVWSVAEGFLVACLTGAGALTAARAEAVTRWIVGQPVAPSYVVFREEGFADDTVKANVEAGLRQAGCRATLWVL